MRMGLGIALVIVVALALLVTDGATSREWGQFGATLLFAALLYVNGLGDEKRWAGYWRVGTPKWLAWLLGRPNQHDAVLFIVVSQLAALGLMVGEVGWFLVKPKTALVGAIAGGVLLPLVVLPLWGLWGIVTRRNPRV